MFFRFPILSRGTQIPFAPETPTGSNASARARQRQKQRNNVLTSTMVYQQAVRDSHNQAAIASIIADIF